MWWISDKITQSFLLSILLFLFNLSLLLEAGHDVDDVVDAELLGVLVDDACLAEARGKAVCRIKIKGVEFALFDSFLQ